MSLQAGHYASVVPCRFGSSEHVLSKAVEWFPQFFTKPLGGFFTGFLKFFKLDNTHIVSSVLLLDWTVATSCTVVFAMKTRDKRMQFFQASGVI